MTHHFTFYIHIKKREKHWLEIIQGQKEKGRERERERLFTF